MFIAPEERTVLNKERLGGYYRLSSYYLARVTVETPVSLVLPTVFVTIIFWMSGLNYDFVVFLQCLLIMLLTVITARVSSLHA